MASRMFRPDKEGIACLEALVKGSSRMVVLTHTRPDGDAAGSATAMYGWVRSLRPEADAVVVFDTPVPGFLEFLLEGVRYIVAETAMEEALKAIGEADLLLVTDLSGLDRTGSLEQAARSSMAHKVLVDHHLSPKREEFALVFSETETSSACELLFDILKAVPSTGGKAANLPSGVLKALMTGMTTDTNNFANSVFPSTLEMASELLAAGVDRDWILDRIYNSCRENRIRAFSYLLGQKMKLMGEGCAYMVMTAEESAGFDLREGETEGLVNVPLTMADVRLSLFLREDGDHYRFSARSKAGVSANVFAKTYFHGGGHERAAGGKLYFPQDIPSRDDAAAYVEKAVKAFFEGGTITADTTAK